MFAGLESDRLQVAAYFGVACVECVNIGVYMAREEEIVAYFRRSPTAED